MATTFAAIDPTLKWYLTLFLLTAALVGVTVWASRVWNVLKSDGDEERTDPKELISPLAQAFAAGQMTEEEYQRIKQSVRASTSWEDDYSVPRKPKPAKAERSDEIPPDAPA